MDPHVLTAYIQAASILISFGRATVDQVRAMFKAHPAMTEAELNLILEAVRSDADRRKAMAQGDAGLPRSPGRGDSL